MAVSLAFVVTMPQLVVHTSTTTAVQTATTTTVQMMTATSTRIVTVISTQTVTPGMAGSYCDNASIGVPLPSPNIPWFIARVNYSGPWEALSAIYNSGSPIFAGCYTGGGQGFFTYQNSSLTGTATIRITATKLDGGKRTLTVAVNGNINSTAKPYGSTTVSAPVDNAGP